MEVCKWVRTRDMGLYEANCGWKEGERVNPKRKYCPHCKRKIKRITLNILSKPMQELQEALVVKIYK